MVLLVPIHIASAATQHLTPYGAPVKLVIPSINVKANVEYTGINGAGILLAPKDPQQVGWFRNGTIPGLRGNAIIGGHVNWKTGSAVFRSLARLRRGAVVQVVNDYGKTLRFQVTGVQIYRNGAVPLSQVVGASRGAHLNLYTCTGTYNYYAKNYSHRIVVYTNLVK